MITNKTKKGLARKCRPLDVPPGADRPPPLGTPLVLSGGSHLLKS